MSEPGYISTGGNLSIPQASFKCPFCGHMVFELRELKRHLEQDCQLYKKIFIY